MRVLAGSWPRNGREIRGRHRRQTARYHCLVAIDPVLDQALALPESERAEIAAALLASIGPEPEADQEAVDRAWAAELKRRIDRIDSGEDVPVPAEEVFAEVRRSLRA